MQKTIPKLLSQWNFDARLREGGLSCLDIGCGVGVAVGVLADAYPKCRFVGLDFDQKAVDEARKSFAGVKNAEFHFGDAGKLVERAEWHGTFDLVTMFDSET